MNEIYLYIYIATGCMAFILGFLFGGVPIFKKKKTEPQKTMQYKIMERLVEELLELDDDKLRFEYFKKIVEQGEVKKYED